MWEKWVFHSDTKLTNSSMIFALSTGMPQYYMLYSQARELARYLLERIEHERLASYYSASMEEMVYVNDESQAELPGYYVDRLKLPHSEASGDLLLFSGNASPRQHTYEFCDSLLRVAKDRWGLRTIVSLGARWTEEPTQLTVESSKVYGFGGTAEDAALLRSLGVLEHPSEVAPFVANMIVGLSPLYGISGMKLAVDHGEVRPHPKQVKSLLTVLQKMLGFELDLSQLDEEAEKLKLDVNVLSKIGKSVIDT